ncbi:MAG: YceI family protein [Verrucomicrobiota bacterium]
MPTKTISPLELQQIIDSKSPLQLINPLTEDSFAQSHIPTSQNLCVYEIAFEENAKEKLNPQTPTVVYGQNDSFEAASLAAEKLQTLGFQNLSILEGGLETWASQNFPTQTLQSSPIAPSGDFEADLEKSHLRWVGRNLFNQHNGTIAISSATLSIDKGEITGGKIELDMTRITCHDIDDSKMNGILIAHLSNNDFFLTSEFPTASFDLSSITTIPNATYGKPNYTLKGTAIIRGNSQPISSSAIVGYNAESISIQGQFDLDRTDFGSKYGSGRFYEALGMHLVNDLISVSFQLTFPR